MVNAKELALGVISFENVVTAYEELSDLIQKQDLGWKPAFVKRDYAEKTSYVSNLDMATIPFYDTCPQEELDVKGKISCLFTNSFSEPINFYFEKYRFKTDSQFEYTILRYGVGLKLGEHIDNYNLEKRHISLIYYLNDEYTGGELEFPLLNLTFKPNANQLLLFPSNYIYRHYVNEVYSGTRYSVVNWLAK
jgi:hypothetical protein